MSISNIPGSNTRSVTPSRRNAAPRGVEATPKDSCEIGQSDPMARVDDLIASFRKGEIQYAPEIAAKIRPQELTLGHFPCQKYILRDGSGTVDTRELPSEIVPRGEKSRYKKAIVEKSKLSEKETAKDLKERTKSIRKQANELYAQRSESLMFWIDGDNAGGKDGIIKHVFELNPMTTNGQQAFKGANAEEKQHDPNWRIMKNLAGPGQIAFHNRSAYGDVVFASKTDADKARRLAEIKEMEYGLTMGLPMTPEGRIALPDKIGNVDPSAIQRPPMRIIKVMLNVSSQEQAARLADRLTDDRKLYKITQADLDGHPHHDDIQTSFATAMAAASTPWSPTYFIPNDNKLTGWRKMAQIADEVLADMSPQPPGFKGDMDASARKQAARSLRSEVDAALRKR